MIWLTKLFQEWFLYHGMFVSPQWQVANVRDWNQRFKWGFTEADFANLPPPPTWPWSLPWSRNRFQAVVLVPYLSHWLHPYLATFEALWGIVRSQHSIHSLSLDRVDAATLQLRSGGEQKVGLRWRVLDLAAHWAPKHGFTGLQDTAVAALADAEVLAAAAHFPAWVQAMDGRKIPYVLLGGYKAYVVPLRGMGQPSSEGWVFLSRGPGGTVYFQVILDLSRSGSMMAVPVSLNNTT